ncbi:hypothetical protein [Halarcobacter sp.]|uniref:hypothetical protein n=1 Tax=Halarcobacter sp. TaxID=2321133 RepID=UPI0029F5064F|nr:hypothetical protein [Halarcobacter sp.]
MCLLKDIKVKCSSSKDEHLCSNHRLIYKTWCEAGGYLKLIVNNVDASEIENIEYFKDILVDLEFDIESLDLDDMNDNRKLHDKFQDPIKYYIL